MPRNQPQPWYKSKLASLALLTLLSISLNGCFFFNNPPQNTVDPYEKFNRQVFKFNMAVDQVIYKPVAKVYDAAVPPQYDHAVHNFFSNLDEIPSFANDILQLDFYHATAGAWRFAMNSTLGVGGLMDVAKHTGLHKHHNDFGITMAKWGVRRSEYVVIPFLGPSTMRDSFGYAVNYMAFTVYPHLRVPVRYSLLGLDLIEKRAELLPADKLIQQAFDPYIFVRDAYLQTRQQQIERVLTSEKEGESKDTYVEETDYHAGGMGLPTGAARSTEASVANADATKK